MVLRLKFSPGLSCQCRPERMAKAAVKVNFDQALTGTGALIKFYLLKLTFRYAKKS